MSTKVLRVIVGMMGCSGVPEKCLHCGATRELEAIEDAAKAYASHRPFHTVDVDDVLRSIARDAP